VARSNLLQEYIPPSWSVNMKPSSLFFTAAVTHLFKMETG